VRRLPAWMLLILAGLTVALLWVGYDKRDEVGPVPLILGAVWAIFVLAAAPRVFSRD
jgi:hypothetical protein